MRGSAAAVVLALGTLASPGAGPVPPDVAEATMCLRVVDRMPQRAGTAFPAGTEVFCWTRLVGFAAGSSIEHVWYRGDREIYRRRIEIGGTPWRAWSRKAVPAGAAGSWRVDVVAPDGRVLRSLKFEVR